MTSVSFCSHSLAIEINDIDLSFSTRKRLVFWKFPFAVWIVGIVISCLAAYLLYHLTLGKAVQGNIFKGYDEGHWWQYVIVVVIFGLSFTFLAAGRVKTYNFNKKTNEFSVYKTNVLCLKRGKFFKLNEISGIYAVRRGHSGINLNTIHYKIIIEINGTHQVKVLETSRRAKCKWQVRLS
jgi:hypothetical protein